jgi:hypothetical protein
MVVGTSRIESHARINSRPPEPPATTDRGEQKLLSDGKEEEESLGPNPDKTHSAGFHE